MLCHNTSRAVSSLDQSNISSQNSKFSLRNRKFGERTVNSSASSARNSDLLLHSRFQKFISNQNSNLRTKKNHQEKDSREINGFFNCFQSANNVLNLEKDLPATLFSRKCTYSTMSSSNLSEAASQKQNSKNSQSQVAAFKINTHSIIQQLAKERVKDQLSQKDNSISSFNVDLDFASFNKLGTSYCSRKSSLNKSGKISVRKQKEKLLSQLSYSGRESLNYVHLKENHELGNHIKEEIGQSIIPYNMNKATNKIQFIGMERVPRVHNNKCKCSAKCKWAEKWMSLVKQSKKEQNIMVRKDSLSQIQKDIPRTQISRYRTDIANCKYQIKDLLMKYSSLRPEIGYVQGMNIIASSILTHQRYTHHARDIFNFIMIEKKYQLIYEGDLSFVQKLSTHLHQELRKYSSNFCAFLSQNGVQIEMFIRSWYFSMLGSFVPLQSQAYIIDKFIRKSFKGINEIILTLLIYLKQELLQTHPDELTTKFTNSWLISRSQMIDWSQLVSCSQNIMLKQITL